MQEANSPIGREEIARARRLLKEYKAGKASLERRIIQNEQWWKLRHWSGDGDQRASAWLVNCIANKHADAMNEYPEPHVFPRERGDAREAEALTGILPVILEQNDYEQVYSDMWWYKLKAGTGVTGVFWNPGKHNGLGDVDIRSLDLLNIFWEPGIKDIQASENLFTVELVNTSLLRGKYPLLTAAPGNTLDVAQYIYDDGVDTSKKTAVVDWYYKRRENGREVLHYVKFAGDTVLYATENDPRAQGRGFYDHGQYPLVLDVLFPEEGTPAGYGYIDVCKQAQTAIDKLDQALLKNAMMATRPRWFVRGDGAINEEEYGDWNRDFIHYHGSGNPQDNLVQVEVKTLPDVYVAILNNKIEELKETSGNRDFNQGGTHAGVTAASAIAALQEAGSKLSRDMIRSSHRAFSRVNYLMIELIRQFYDEPRCFRITGKGGMGFERYSNRALRPQAQLAGDVAVGYRLPVFDVKVQSLKASPFSRMSQNELAQELFARGYFDPARAEQAMTALSMMDFQGREEIMARVAQNSLVQRKLDQALRGLGERKGSAGRAGEALVQKALEDPLTQAARRLAGGDAPQ